MISEWHIDGYNDACLACLIEKIVGSEFGLQGLDFLRRRTMPVGLKRGWVVLDEKSHPSFCAHYPEACHEHINDAINEYKIDGAEKWVVREMLILPVSTGA